MNSADGRPAQPLRVLMVEDSEDDALLLADHFRAAGIPIECRRVETEAALNEALRQPWDIVLSDFSMPHFSGTRALEVLRAHDPDMPLIFVSGTIGEATAVEAMRAGAQDYVMKDNLARLLPAVDREIHEVRLRRERRQAQETVTKLSRVVEQAADSVFITDPDGHIEYVNPAFVGLTGYSPAETAGRTPALLKSGCHDDAFYRVLWQTVIRGDTFKGVLINRRKDGGLFYEEKVITPLKDGYGRITHLVSTGRDITARVRADEARNRLAAILEATTDLVAMFDPEGRLRYLNSAGQRMLGLAGSDELQRYQLGHIFPDALARELLTTALSTTGQEVRSGETVLRRVDGGEIPVSQVLLTHRNDAGQLEYLSAIARDITERKRFEAELQHQATHDGLTGLPNRFLLADRCVAELKGARRRGRFVAVMFLDLDDFKRINDSFGHAAGDLLLQQVARRLQSALRPNDTVARHGGDEFTLLLVDLEKVESVLTVLRKVRAAFERPLLIERQDVYVTFSTGIAIYPHDSTRVEELLRNADSAMYRAKAMGQDQYRFYTPEMNDRGHELLALETDLRRALKRNEFRLHYQPQMALTSRRIVGIEGLLRWQHPQRGLMPPADFVPLLESTGLIIAVGEWVLRQACIHYRDDIGNDGMRVSINISANQFNDPDLLDKVRRVLVEEGMPPNRLELEITENTLMRDPTAATTTLQALHAMGIRIAIDDFGTGYSSLAYLKRFPLDVLKIDQGFVRDLTYDPSDAAIVEASISLARKLGLEVIAEGVETAAQLDFLTSSQCDMAQGYYLGRPLPVAELVELLD